MINFLKISKFFLYLAPLAVILVTPSTLFPFIVGKYVFFRITVGLALIFFLIAWAFGGGSRVSNPVSRILKSPLAVAVSVFVFIFLAAGFLGVDPTYSFWSNFERGEGGLQILFFYAFFLLLFLVFKEESEWRKMFLFSLVAASLMIFYGIGAGLKYVDMEMITVTQNGALTEVPSGNGGPYFQWFKNFIGPKFGDRFQGTIGNSAYVAAYLIFAMFYAAYLLIDKYRHRFKSFSFFALAVAVVFFMTFFFLAATRGAFIGLIAAALAFLVYMGISVKNWRKWFLMGAIGLLAIVGSLVYFKESFFVKNLPGSRMFDISFYAQNIQERMVIWQIAVDGVSDRPLLGWGPENFPVVFDKHYNPAHYSVERGFGAWYDRAHNVFLDYLISVGFLGLLSYLAIFGVFYWQLFKRNYKSQITNYKQITNSNHQIQNIANALLFSLPIAYLVQGLVLFDILPIYLNLFLFLAFAGYVFGKNSVAETKNDLPDSLKKIIAVAAIIGVVALIYLGAILPFAKAKLYTGSFGQIHLIKNVEEFKRLFDVPLNFYSPVGQEEAVRFLAGEIFTKMIYPGQAEGVVRQLMDYIEPRIFENNSRHLLLTAWMYGRMFEIYGKQDYLNKAEEYFQKILILNPKSPQALRSLLGVYQVRGEAEKVKETGKIILRYWPEEEMAIGNHN
ncbi:MAG: O-antigen ligase family protein [Patescibacteria group bacterium]